MASGTENMSYNERLEVLNMPKLEYRRKVNIITMYKIVTKNDEFDKEEFLKSKAS